MDINLELPVQGKIYNVRVSYTMSVGVTTMENDKPKDVDYVTDKCLGKLIPKVILSVLKENI